MSYIQRHLIVQTPGLVHAKCFGESCHELIEPNLENTVFFRL